MGHLRITLVTITVLSLTAALLRADETPTAMGPLSVLEDCIQAAEAGEFERYVDHLSADEQKLQAGYILYMTRSMASVADLGSSAVNPNTILIGRTMSDLVKKHTVVPTSEQKAEYQEATKILAQLSGQVAVPFAAVRQNPQTGREICMKITGVLKEAGPFLVEALGELARPTEVSGEPGVKIDAIFDIGKMIKRSKDAKWTLYTRGMYAIAAESPKPDPQPPAVGYQTIRLSPRMQLEFTRIDGRWVITRLMPASVMTPLNRMAALR